MHHRHHPFWPVLLLAGLIPGNSARAEALTAEEIGAWFQPDRVQDVALSRDGRHLAYTVHEQEKTSLMLVAVDDPDRSIAVPVGEDAIIPNSQDTEKTPLRVSFLRWSESGRLVFAAEQPALDARAVRSKNGPALLTAVYAIDADGRNLLKLGDGDSFAIVDSGVGAMETISFPREPHVIDLAPDEPDAVLVAALGPALNSGSYNPNLHGRVATGLFKINLHTGRRQTMDDRDINGRLLYDRQGHARIEARRPLDQRVQSFIYLNPPAGQARGSGLQKMVGDDVSPENYLGSRTFPLGFDYDPNLLYVASNAGRDTYGLLALDLRAGKRTPLPVELPGIDLADFERPFSDSDLVFDRARHRLVGVRVRGTEEITQWLDPEFAEIQAVLNGRFDGRKVQLLEWDATRQRILALVASGADPGRYYVFDRKNNRLIPFVRRAPEVDADETSAAAPFAFDTAEGVHLTGYLTLPRTPRANPPPLLVYCHGGPWQRDEPGFNRDAQVLAAMGFVVVQVNYRGSAGFGTQWREAAREDFDRLPIADIRAAIAWVATQHKIDGKRVVLMGQEFGGYLALRALQLYPDSFRCAIAINAPTDLEAWCRKPESRMEAIGRQRQVISDLHASILLLTGKADFSGRYNPKPAAGDGSFPSDPDSDLSDTSTSGTSPIAPPPPDFAIAPINFLNEFRRWYFGGNAVRLAALSPARHAELLTQPILLIQDPLDLDGEAGKSRSLRAALNRAGNPATYFETTSAFTRRLPAASAEVYVQIQEFFNLSLYNFNVKVGIPEVAK